MGLAIPCASARPSREYDLKAAFLYNFLAFVEWPEEVFESADSPFVLGVIGSNPFGGSLEQMIEGELIGGRRCEIRQIRRLDEIASCHILFIPGNESWRLSRILQAARNHSVLTVADIPGFSGRGGMIEFRSEGQFIRLAINRLNAREEGLRISAKLLQLAQLIGEAEPTS